MKISNVSKATESIVTKSHLEPPGAKGRKICSNRSGQMTNMPTTPICGKNLYKSSTPEPVNRWP